MTPNMASCMGAARSTVFWHDDARTSAQGSPTDIEIQSDNHWKARAQVNLGPSLVGLSIKFEPSQPGAVEWDDADKRLMRGGSSPRPRTDSEVERVPDTQHNHLWYPCGFPIANDGFEVMIWGNPLVTAIENDSFEAKIENI